MFELVFLLPTNLILKEALKHLHVQVLLELQKAQLISPHVRKIRKPETQNQTFGHLDHKRALGISELLSDAVECENVMAVEANDSIEVRMFTKKRGIFGSKYNLIVADLLFDVVEDGFGVFELADIDQVSVVLVLQDLLDELEHVLDLFIFRKRLLDVPVAS